MSNGFSFGGNIAFGNSIAPSSVLTNNNNNNTSSTSLFLPSSTTTTQTIQSLDANETKEEKSETDDTKTNDNPSLSAFAIDRNTRNTSLQRTYCITSDQCLPSCETTIHWNISRRAIDQSRANKSTIKPNKKLTILPSG
eukprot:123109_1